MDFKNFIRFLIPRPVILLLVLVPSVEIGDFREKSEHPCSSTPNSYARDMQPSPCCTLTHNGHVYCGSHRFAVSSCVRRDGVWPNIFIDFGIFINASHFCDFKRYLISSILFLMRDFCSRFFYRHKRGLNFWKQ